MQVKTDNRLCLDARARAEPTDDLLYHDYYTRTPCLRLTAEGAGEAAADAAVAVMLEAADVAELIACAIRHPSLNMRQSVWTAIWNHPDSFREILRFGLDAPAAFGEIREIVATELGRRAAAQVPQADPAAAGPHRPAEHLLPRMPLPAHLRRSGRE